MVETLLVFISKAPSSLESSRVNSAGSIHARRRYGLGVSSRRLDFLRDAACHIISGNPDTWAVRSNSASPITIRRTGPQ
jgi:hypothetical protein